MSFLRSAHLAYLAIGLTICAEAFIALFHQPRWMVSGAALTLDALKLAFAIGALVGGIDILIQLLGKAVRDRVRATRARINELQLPGRNYLPRNRNRQRSIPARMLSR